MVTLSGRIRVETTNLDTGVKWSRELGPDEWAVIYGPEMELIEHTPLLLRRGARMVVCEKPIRRRTRT